jgi:hypothetical protein
MNKTEREAYHATLYIINVISEIADPHWILSFPSRSRSDLIEIPSR